MEYTWKITGVQVLNSPFPNTVAMATFTIARTDEDGITGATGYTVNLLPASDDDETFQSFEGLTEETLIAWTKEALGDDRVSAMEAEVETNIAVQKAVAPASVSLPWAAAE